MAWNPMQNTIDHSQEYWLIQLDDVENPDVIAATKEIAVDWARGYLAEKYRDQLDNITDIQVRYLKKKPVVWLWSEKIDHHGHNLISIKKVNGIK